MAVLGDRAALRDDIGLPAAFLLMESSVISAPLPAAAGLPDSRVSRNSDC